MKWLLMLLLVVAALADEPTKTRSMWSEYELEQLGAPGEAPPNEQAVDRTTERIASGLRCPVCQGMPVSESPAETAVTWKNAVRDLVEMGYSRDQIEAFFVRRHGEWVLLAPPAKGLNWLLWLAPAIIMGVGLTLLGSWASNSSSPKITKPTETGSQPAAKDPYEVALLSEIED